MLWDGGTTADCTGFVIEVYGHNYIKQVILFDKVIFERAEGRHLGEGCPQA